MPGYKPAVGGTTSQQATVAGPAAAAAASKPSAVTKGAEPPKPLSLKARPQQKKRPPSSNPSQLSGNAGTATTSAATASTPGSVRAAGSSVPAGCRGVNGGGVPSGSGVVDGQAVQNGTSDPARKPKSKPGEYAGGPSSASAGLLSSSSAAGGVAVNHPLSGVAPSAVGRSSGPITSNQDQQQQQLLQQKQRELQQSLLRQTAGAKAAASSGATNTAGPSNSMQQKTAVNKRVNAGGGKILKGFKPAPNSSGKPHKSHHLHKHRALPNGTHAAVGSSGAAAAAAGPQSSAGATRSTGQASGSRSVSYDAATVGSPSQQQQHTKQWYTDDSEPSSESMGTQKHQLRQQTVSEGDGGNVAGFAFAASARGASAPAQQQQQRKRTPDFLSVDKQDQQQHQRRRLTPSADPPQVNGMDSSGPARSNQPPVQQKPHVGLGGKATPPPTNLPESGTSGGLSLKRKAADLQQVQAGTATDDAVLSARPVAAQTQQHINSKHEEESMTKKAKRGHSADVSNGGSPLVREAPPRFAAAVPSGFAAAAPLGFAAAVAAQAAAVTEGPMGFAAAAAAGAGSRASRSADTSSTDTGNAGRHNQSDVNLQQNYATLSVVDIPDNPHIQHQAQQPQQSHKQQKQQERQQQQDQPPYLPVSTRPPSGAAPPPVISTSSRRPSPPPEQDPDLMLYKAYLGRKAQLPKPITSAAQYEDSVQEYSHKYSLYMKLHHKIQANIAAVEAVVSSLQSCSPGSSAWGEAEEQLRVLLAAKGAMARQWDAAFRTLHNELDHLKKALKAFVSTHPHLNGQAAVGMNGFSAHGAPYPPGVHEGSLPATAVVGAGR